MPLFVRKAHYHHGDQVLASFWIAGNRHNPTNATLSLVLGCYERLYSIRQGRYLPSIEPYWQLDCKIQGDIVLRDARDSGTLDVRPPPPDQESKPIIEGLVLGQVDIEDWYEIRSYLLRCLYTLKPYYQDLLHDSTLQNL